MSNSLDPDQDWHSVSPDLGPNCLQRLLTDVKSRLYQGRTSYMYMHNVSLNMHAQLASEARLLNFVQSHHLLQNFVYASSEASGLAANMPRFIRAFAACLCDKYQISCSGNFWVMGLLELSHYTNGVQQLKEKQYYHANSKAMLYTRICNMHLLLEYPLLFEQIIYFKKIKDNLEMIWKGRFFGIKEDVHGLIETQINPTKLNCNVLLM